MTPETFNDWLQGAREGSQAIYFEGYLAQDRYHLRQTDKGVLYYIPDPLVSAIGRRAWAAWQARYVYLTQHKLAEGVYAYIATRSHRRIRKNWDDVSIGSLSTPVPITLSSLKPTFTSSRRPIPFNPPRL